MTENSGELVSSFLKEQVDREDQRRQRLETRAGIVVSGSTAAIAALFASLTYVYSRDKTVLHGSVRWSMYLGLAAFATAVGIAVFTLWPRGEYVTRVDDDLRHYLNKSNFQRDASYSSRRVAESRLAELESIIEVNNRLAPLLLSSQILQATGLLFIAVAISYLFG